MKRSIKEKNNFIKFLVYKRFGYLLVDGQADLVRRIYYREDAAGNHCRRFSVSAYTQYGKTFCVSIAIGLLISEFKTKVAFIGPKQEQAGLLRQYMADLILKDINLLSKAMINIKGDVRISKEASRKRMTFSNGSEYRVFSAEGEANRLMGFGVGIKDGLGIIVKDEACLISREADAKIGRMMGNNPENCILIELYNPWDRDNIAHDNSINPKFDQTHIDWEQGVKEGRTTRNFVMEQKGIITPLEFTVLYESKFPDESEDQLIPLNKIIKAEDSKIDLAKELKELEKILLEPQLHQEFIVKRAEEDIKKFTKIISCDPADKGLDETLIYWGIKKDNFFHLVGYYFEGKSESMEIVGMIFDKVIKFIGRSVKGMINFDGIGLGVGPVSRLRELLREKNISNVRVVDCKFGEKALKPEYFMNKKSENYFGLRAIFIDELIRIPKVEKLRKHLVAMKWELTSSAKKKIIDPDDYSPDWADALCYFTWNDRSAMLFDFV